MPPASAERIIESFSSRAVSQLQAIAGRAAGGVGRQPPPSKEEPQKVLLDRLNQFINRAGAIAGGVAVGAAGTATALARRGFSGTVEGARFDYAMEQLSRQIAAVFQPVIQGMTYAATRFDFALRNMDGSGQNRLLYGALGTLAGFAARGPAGALMGGGMGLGLTGPDISPLGVGAAAWAGFRVGGPVGAATAAGGALALTAPDRFEGETVGEYYSRMREAGGSRFGSAARVLGKSIDIGFSAIGSLFGGGGETFAPKVPPAPEKKRDVTLFQNEMTAAGQAYFEIQKAVLRTTAGGADDGGPFKPFIDLLLEIIRLLGIVAGVDVKFTDPADSIKGSHVGFVGAVGEMLSGFVASLPGRK